MERKVHLKDRIAKTEHFRLALDVAGLNLKYEYVDLILKVYDRFIQNQNDLTIKDISTISIEWNEKWNKYYEINNI